VADLSDYLELTPGQAREQFRALLSRQPVSTGRQVTFLPVETLLCLAASYLVNHRSFGGSTAHLAPEPGPALAHVQPAIVERAGKDGESRRVPDARREVGRAGRRDTQG